MPDMVNPIPDGYHSITPYLVVPDIQVVLDFVQRAFDAEVTQLIKTPDGTPMHAEVQIGDSKVMMGQPRDGTAPMPAMLYIYVADTDATYQRALDAGATSEMAPEDQFYGDRNAGVVDTVGNRWWIGTHIEDVSPEELQRRAAARG